MKLVRFPFSFSKNICWRIKQTPKTHRINSPCNKTPPHNAKRRRPQQWMHMMWNIKPEDKTSFALRLHIETKTSHKSRVFLQWNGSDLLPTLFCFCLFMFFLLFYFFLYQLLCWKKKVPWKAASKMIFVVFPALFFLFFFYYFHDFFIIIFILFFFTPFW